MGTWIARHSYALATNLRWLRDQSAAALLAVLALALALMLPLGLALLVLKAGAASALRPSAAAIAVYLKPATSEQRARELATSARARHDVAAVTVITAAQALQELRSRSGLGSALDTLPDNPLPNVLEIVPAPAAAGTSMATELETLRVVFAAWPETDTVQLDREWGQRWDATAAFAPALLGLSAVLLGLVVIGVVAHTTRLAIRGRRAEIELAKLVGASSAFVRRPFLYLGALHGVAAALAACGLLRLAARAFAEPAGALVVAYGLALVPPWPDARELGALVGAALLLGWLGATIAAAREVARLHPQL